jgi:hypothetical protein
VTKPKAKGNIRLKRVIGFNNSVSLGIILPRAFVRALELKANQYVSVELHDEDKMIVVKGLISGQLHTVHKMSRWYN